MTTDEEALEKARAIAARLQAGLKQGSSVITNSSSGGGGGEGKAVSASSASSQSSGLSDNRSLPPSTTTATTASTTTGKRKRWGVVADDVLQAQQQQQQQGQPQLAIPSAAALLLAASTAKVQKAEETIQKRVWVATGEGEKPVSHYASYLNRTLPELKPRLLADWTVNNPAAAADDSAGNNEKKSNNENTQFVMELQGRGSSSRPPVPGMPEQPLHVYLSGPSSLIHRAVPEVERILQEAQEAPLEAGAEDHDRSGSEGGQGSKNKQGALVALGHSSGQIGSSSSYRPASVAQLIGQATLPNAGFGDGSSSNPHFQQPQIEEEMSVPHGVVGFIIGRGGENITQMQAKTGCKIQIQKEGDLQPGQTQRIITLVATSQEAIDACRQRIESMVQERIRAAGGSSGPGGGASGSGHHHHQHGTNNHSGGAGGANNHTGNNASTGSKDAKVQEALNSGHVHLEMRVPEEDVGLVIGKMGSTIKSIQDQTGASIQVPPSVVPGQGMRIVHITHPQMEGAQNAKQQIENILKGKPNFHNRGPSVTVQISIPDKDVGLCIGRQGCVIRQMQNLTNTRIQIPPQANPGEMHRVASVSGTQEGCDQVQQMIHRIITEQSSSCVMSGLPFTGAATANNANPAAAAAGQYYQQSQQLAHGNQQGDSNQQQAYSAEWAAYHAAQAAVQQQQQQQPAPAAAASGQPAADAYYEQFYRYAYYYGEDAARSYYGAWSPPVGTPNPYGVNPAGIQPAPATGQVPVPAAAVAQTQTADSATQGGNDARETGRRKVSNLPAWMTKN